ncbi:putative inactive poly [ADP-ribose] polymerase SRO1 [Vitis vinifera]|uniref:Putative inactive poly [ADP-ribose] polymerase SRO1 n=1 Tax=Vitis vinifera TaxID=29760 RepID=A0A438KML0_VITVI|nr:putative inactive poly [ADP-ribose] polymerase SRO1 [Vitis vinifera]
MQGLCSGLLFLSSGGQNQANFERSGVPSRFMFYRDGSWVDFPSQVLENVRPGFLERKTTMDVSIDGSEYRFDFLRMLQIDILTGKGRSIAWIDANGKCFFPKLFVSEEAADGSENLNTKSKIRFGEYFGKRKRERLESQEESEGNSSTNREAVSRRWNSNDQEAVSKRQRIQTTCDSETCKWPNVKLMKKGGRPYAMAEKFFLSRLKDTDPAVRVTAIHQCTWKGPLEKARWDVFHKQMERTKAAQGICNTTFAWHGRRPKPAMMSEADDNEEKHVLLCRVILGNVEMVEDGPLPSSVNFDTGVDNMRILHGQMRPLAFLKWVPYSSNAFVVKLFSKLEILLPSEKSSGIGVLVQNIQGWQAAQSASNISILVIIKSLVTVKLALSKYNRDIKPPAAAAAAAPYTVHCPSGAISCPQLSLLDYIIQDIISNSIALHLYLLSYYNLIYCCTTICSHFCLFAKGNLVLDDFPFLVGVPTIILVTYHFLWRLCSSSYSG